MSSDNEQILMLAKAGLTAEEIAKSLGYQLEDVILILERHEETKQELAKSCGADYTEDDEMLADRVIRELAQIADKDSVKLKAATYIKDQCLGLKVPPRVTNVIVTADQLNELFRSVKERKRQLVAGSIEIESTLAV